MARKHEPPTRRYLLWSHEHRAWWRPMRNGYTTEIAEAGRYALGVCAQVCFDHVPPGVEVAIDERFASMAEPGLKKMADVLRAAGCV